MGEVHKIAGGFAVSIGTLATEFGMARGTVSKRLDKCGVQSFGEVRGFPTYRLRDAVKAILGVTGERRDDEDGFNPEKLPPNERLAWMRGESERLKIAAGKRELLPAAEFESALSGVLKALLQKVETIGDRLERDCALGPDAVRRVDEIVAEIRRELHESLTAGNPSESE